MIPPDWTPHRRDDGELVGWIRPEGEYWVAVDLLGHAASGPVDWLEAEATLETRGLSWLAEVWMLEREAAGPLRVKLVEVTPGAAGEAGRVVVQTDDFGAIDVPVDRYALPWPSPAALRPRRPDDVQGSPFD
ncbi:hypothetical protein NQ152_05565 [Microbacterium sp. zg.B48]|uniref:hypothetical protein n=1 Tax=unclassified Microbacterium TaxID=2609290 RepID=UPI00214C8DF2|nr:MULTISPECIES: hypothetical protein [unclassified Microbacterium]MCR2762974.1 hypothetical protein [Microbacterium sp. zg.B48]MCR2808560.1 hypothetical protein [Microbacterium sp. zg.B185]WIM19002.1 hypothetical protein QNO12_15685 [Microbacterium sp. zg-B185]